MNGWNDEKKKLAEAVYLTLLGVLSPEHRAAGVEDAYVKGGVCDRAYERVNAVRERLRLRCGTDDTDEDVDEILIAMDQIQYELCMKMFQYGARFAEENKM